MKTKTVLNGIWEFSYQGKKAKIDVPSNWYRAGFDISGAAEYSRVFNLKKQAGKRYFLTFTGVDYFCEAFVNGKPAGKHEGYFQKFRFDVTDSVKSGKNSVKVSVNAPKEAVDIWPNSKYLIKGIFNHHDARPGSWNKKTGQNMNTGGIWNGVYIESVDAVEIERVKITPLLKDDGVWNSGSELIINNYTQKTVTATLAQSISPYNFKGKAQSLKRELSLKPGPNTIYLHADIKNPALWWTWDYGKQNLYEFSYTVKAGTAKDAYSDITGIREFKRGEDRAWYLNGKRLFIRGTNIIPTQMLSEYTKEKAANDIKLLIGANLNMVRIHAHVNRKELYYEADKAGIMVWQDFALQWGYETTETFMENAVSQIKDMINQHYNRPSITFWCCHNEPFVSEKQLDPVLYIKAREADPVRYIEKASDFTQHYYPGWYYENTPENFYLDTVNAEKRFIISEYGAEALPCLPTMKKMMEPRDLWPPNWKEWEYHDFQPEQTFNTARVKMGDSLEEFIENSQQYQADIIKTHTETYRLARYKFLNGILHFMFCECWNSITWAVVDYYRNPKKGYFALQTAMQPVYPGYRLVRNTKSKGERLSWGVLWDPFFIINDLPEAQSSVTAEISLIDASGDVYKKEKRKLADIPADAIVYPFQGQALEAFEADPFVIPETAAAGWGRVEIRLYDAKGKQFAENSYKLEITERVGGVFGG
jgi:beta-mannosidase